MSNEPTYDDLKAMLASREVQLKQQQEISQMYYNEAQRLEDKARKLDEALEQLEAHAAGLGPREAERLAIQDTLMAFYDHSPEHCADEYGHCEACEGIRQPDLGVKAMLAEIRGLTTSQDSTVVARLKAENLQMKEALNDSEGHIQALKLYNESCEEAILDELPGDLPRSGYWPADVIAYIRQQEALVEAYEQNGAPQGGQHGAHLGDLRLMLQGALTTLAKVEKAL